MSLRYLGFLKIRSQVKQNRRKRISGFSLIEVMVAAGILMGLSYAIMMIIGISVKGQSQVSINAVALNEMESLKGFLNNSNAWAYTVANDTNLKNCVSSTTSTCTSTNAATAKSLAAVYNPGGTVAFTAYTPGGANGFTAQGAPCQKFVPPATGQIGSTGNDSCPLAYQVQWYCSGTTAGACYPPNTISLILTLYYNPSAKNAVALNPTSTAYTTTFTQGSGQSVTSGCTWVPGATSVGENCGNVGVGTLTPTAAFDFEGANAILNATGTISMIGKVGIGSSSTDSSPTTGYALSVKDNAIIDTVNITKTATIATANITTDNIGTAYITTDNITTANIAQDNITAATVTGTANFTSAGTVNFNGTTNFNNGLSIVSAGNTVGFTVIAPPTGSPAGTLPTLNISTPMQANDYYYSSDARLKKDIKPIDNALEKLLTLRGVQFNWKKDDRADVGVIAQEVQKTFPQLVHESGTDGYLSVEYGNLVGPIIESIRELKAENAELRKRLEQLEKSKERKSSDKK